MIQQSNLKLKCQQNDHKDEIDTVCYNQYCTEFRFNCFKCIKKGRIHYDHFDDVEKINSLMDFIESKNNECDNLINDLNTFIENMNQSFSQLKMGIKQKYSLSKERLVYLNSLQLNDYLNSTIKLIEYKQSITTIISEQTKKLTHQFNNLYQQLQLYIILQFNLKVFQIIIISQFNYYQIHDNSIKLCNELYDQLIILYQSLGYDLKANLITMFIIYQGDKYDEAIQLLDKSIQQNPNNHLSLWCRGACLQVYYQLFKIQGGQINMRMQSFFQIKHEKLILSMLIPQMTKQMFINLLLNKFEVLLLKKYNESIHKIHFLFNAKGIAYIETYSFQIQVINKNIKKLQFIIRNHQRLIQTINIQQNKQLYLTYQIRILLEDIESMNIQYKQLILIDNYLVQKQIWTDNVSAQFQEFQLTFQFNIYTQILILIQFFFNFLFILHLPDFQFYKNISKQKQNFFFQNLRQMQYSVL